MAERAMRSLHKSIDRQIERARDLEVQHALALYKSGKTELHDASNVIKQARQRVA